MVSCIIDKKGNIFPGSIQVATKICIWEWFCATTEDESALLQKAGFRAVEMTSSNFKYKTEKLLRKK